MNRLLPIASIMLMIFLLSCSGSFSVLKKKDLRALDNMVTIKGGSFMMGLNNELFGEVNDARTKTVTVSDFKISAFEVTNAEFRDFLKKCDDNDSAMFSPADSVWKEFVGMRDYFYDFKYNSYPVVGITWTAAKAFCDSLTRWTLGKTFRLPTEAEWEFAARGSLEGNVYPWGQDLQCPNGDYLANFKKRDGVYEHDGFIYTAPVGSFPPNKYKLYDMGGNVNEWVNDSYALTGYQESDDIDPCFDCEELPDNNGAKVIRGGSWTQDEIYLECGRRQRLRYDAKTNYVGFRIVEVVQ